MVSISRVSRPSVCGPGMYVPTGPVGLGGGAYMPNKTRGMWLTGPKPAIQLHTNEHCLS